MTGIMKVLQKTLKKIDLNTYFLLNFISFGYFKRKFGGLLYIIHNNGQIGMLFINDISELDAYRNHIVDPITFNPGNKNIYIKEM